VLGGKSSLCDENAPRAGTRRGGRRLDWPGPIGENGRVDAVQSRASDLALLRRIAAEAVILQDEAEELLRDVRAREPLAELAPRGGRLASRFVALAAALPACRDPAVRAHAMRLREILDHHALMLTASLDLLAVAYRSDRLEEQVDRISGLGRPARWLEDLRLELLVAGDA
jgi:hypothetical protein